MRSRVQRGGAAKRVVADLFAGQNTVSKRVLHPAYDTCLCTHRARNGAGGNTHPCVWWRTAASPVAALRVSRGQGGASIECGVRLPGEDETSTEGVDRGQAAVAAK